MASHLVPDDSRRLVGLAAELLVCLALGVTGQAILHRRRRVAGVELDIVAARGDQLAIVEVKSRWRRHQAASLEELVTARQRRRLHRAAARLAAQGAVRVHLACVSWWPWPRIRWLHDLPAADLSPAPGRWIF